MLALSAGPGFGAAFGASGIDGLRIARIKVSPVLIDALAVRLGAAVRAYVHPPPPDDSECPLAAFVAREFEDILPEKELRQGRRFRRPHEAGELGVLARRCLEIPTLLFGRGRELIEHRPP